MPIYLDVKGQFHTQRGVTLAELLLLLGLLGIITGTVLLVLRPQELRRQARDSRRVSDLVLLVQAVERYMANHGGTPPDVSGPIRVSLEAAQNHYPQESNGFGWIASDLSTYIEKLPADPINTNDAVYRYRRVGTAYEIDALMENKLQLADNKNDGGNNAARYEVGTDLTLLE